MAGIGADDLEAVLNALGEQLAAADASVHLVVVGGSGLLAIGAIRRATQDVDVVAIRDDDELRSAEPLPPQVVEAARVVARDFGLIDGWLNGGPTGLLDISGLPEGFSSRSSTRRYGAALQVDFASRLDQIYLKLYSWATRHEQRDADDLRALDPSEDELRGAARWARTRDAPGPFDDALADALAAFEVEDEGRIA